MTVWDSYYGIVTMTICYEIEGKVQKLKSVVNSDLSCFRLHFLFFYFFIKKMFIQFYMFSEERIRDNSDLNCFRLNIFIFFYFKLCFPKNVTTDNSDLNCFLLNFLVFYFFLVFKVLFRRTYSDLNCF